MIKKTLFLSILLFGIISTMGINAQEGQKIYKSDEVDVKPSFPGGEKAYRTFIRKEVKFPIEARAQNKKGVVYISYLILADGSIQQVKFAKFMDWIPDADGKYHESKDKIEPVKSIVDEAIRVIKKFPKHEPGQKNGIPVSVLMETKLTFFAAGK